MSSEKVTINDFVINVATVNGSGSQSANTILLKTLFRMGIPVGGKNVFPSNIQGLPTWFWIRASAKGYTGRRELADIVVGMNGQTVLADSQIVKKGGVFFYNSDLKFDPQTLRKDILTIPIPVKQIVDQSTTQVKIKKLVANMVYVGVLAELLKLEETALNAALRDQFGGKAAVIEVNQTALEKGREYAKANLQETVFPFRAETIPGRTEGHILIDGNSAAALGLIFGGASFAAWYPITPSSSLVENFAKYASQLRRDPDGKQRYAVVQAEDELASICMVLGAGWQGARAFTATSGPGVSLMQEAIGYAYYTEIPSVIWDVQRVGPSTGMPTRTAQGDLLLAVFASHGDTKHPVLLPGTATECFEFGQTSFDLAERLQTPVLVLSDLDLGMNLWMEKVFTYPTKDLDRGKVLTAEQLDHIQGYQRYGDPDQDAIPYRTLPGNKHMKASHVVRGSGHTVTAAYTENGPEYLEVVDRLARKWETARGLVPAPVESGHGAKIGLLAYGSVDGPMQEARDLLLEQGVKTDYCRLRALPFHKNLREFLERHETIFVCDLNRDAQLLSLLRMEMPEYWRKLISIRHYDGTPMTADGLAAKVRASLQSSQPEVTKWN